ncbi:MAG: RecX family transcriptional regulator [Pacificimonas sp.]|nr:RecX family transcriptional regulator [Pacificimonas sp.]
MTDDGTSKTGGKRRGQRREKRLPPPLGADSLRELALRYVGRYATTEAKLVRYLTRKVRERGWAEGEQRPDMAAVATMFAERGYLSNRLYGEMKARSLAARGYGEKRVSQQLRADGLGEEDRSAALNEIDARAALTKFARRKRIGPFAREAADRDTERKQFVACLRAGHGFDLVKELFSAESAEAFEGAED